MSKENDYFEEREWAVARWPEADATIIRDHCFDEIMPLLVSLYPHNKLVADVREAGKLFDVAEWVYWFGLTDSAWSDVLDLLDDAHAVKWARAIGNIEEVADQITDDHAIGKFAIRLSEHRDLVRNKIPSQCALEWAIKYEDTSILSRVDNAEDAFHFARKFPETFTQLQELISQDSKLHSLAVSTCS